MLPPAGENWVSPWHLLNLEFPQETALLTLGSGLRIVSGTSSEPIFLSFSLVGKNQAASDNIDLVI